jgi:hypothetical protein
MTNFIECYEGIASADYCKRMIAELESLIATGSDNYLGQVSNFGAINRKDIARYFEKDNLELTEETNKILNSGLKMYLDKYPSLSMLNFYSRNVKVQKTEPKGGFHLWHGEKAASGPEQARCLVWMIYLNTIPEGEGETEFLEFGLKIRPKEGTLVLWPAGWTHTHRGNPVYTQNKYIATGWYYLS